MNGRTIARRCAGERSIDLLPNARSFGNRDMHLQDNWTREEIDDGISLVILVLGCAVRLCAARTVTDEMDRNMVV